MEQRDSACRAGFAESQVDTLPSGAASELFTSGVDSGFEGLLTAPRDDPNYPMRAGRNLCLIFNTTEFDCLPRKRRPLLDNAQEVENLRQTFASLGFDCSLYKNLKAEEMIQTVNSVARNSEAQLEQIDCLVCWIITYGENSQLYARDAEIDMSSITDAFRADECPCLFGKPKLFFVQVMNNEPTMRWEIDAARVMEEAEEERVHKLPVAADFFFGYSSAPGSFDRGDGTDLMLYAKAVTDAINSHVPPAPERMDLSTLMEMVAESVNDILSRRPDNRHGGYQIPCVISTLTRQVQFSRMP